MRTATPEEEALWPSPNFENPEKLHGPIIGVTMTTFILAVVFLATRTLGKRILRQRLVAEDYLIFGAMLVALPTSIFPLVCLNLGLGLHVWDQKPEWHTLYAKLNFASDMFFPTACMLTKVSQCFSYLRLFPGRSNEIFCHIMIVFITKYTIGCIFITLLQCRPIRAHWSSKTGSDCMNTRATIAAIATLNSFSDLMIYLRPMKPLLILQTPAKQRWGLVVLLLMSLPPCIAGLLRLYYVQAFYDSVDELWNASVVWALMMIEMNLGIVCSCFFGVQPMLALLFPRFFAGFYPSKDGSPPRTHRQGSGYPSASEAYPLSDLSTKPGEQRKNQPDKFEALWTPEGRGSNFASASSSGRTRGERLAPGVITVDMEFTVDEEISPCNSPMIEYSGKMGFLMDRLSEDWTGA